METSQQSVIYTIGHSTHSIELFIDMLKSFEVCVLADIRQFPGSRKNPQFNKENLMTVLPKVGIEYLHIETLGGRRKVAKDSVNTRWRNPSFRAYADYMETAGFEKGISLLEEIALRKTTAYMCSEQVWWRCHRSLVSDFLKAKGWKVLHISAVGKSEEHPYTSPARVVDGRVYYYDSNLFNN